jgi:hypothetical protein
MSINLTATNQLLEVVTTAALALDVTSSFRQSGASTTPDSQTAAVATATTTTIVAAPAASTQRLVDDIEIVNKGAGSQTVTVQKDVGGTNFVVFGPCTLAQNERIQFTNDRGWRVFGATGAERGSGVQDAYPVGSIYISTNSTNPATSLGFGTWSAFGAGRVPVGFDSGQTEFDTDEETGGAKTVAAAGTNSAPTFTGAALGTHTHAFTGNALGNHAHELPFQKVAGGTAVLRMLPASTFGTGTSRAAESQSAAPTANTTSAAVELSQAVSAGTPSGTNASVSAGTPSGTVSAPTFTGSATSVLQPYIVVRMWKRTA